LQEVANFGGFQPEACGTLKHLKAALSAALLSLQAPGGVSALVWAGSGLEALVVELGRALQAAVPTQLLAEGFRVHATCGSWDQ
jgi:hypothetical protein